MDKLLFMLLLLGLSPLVVFQAFALRCRVCNEYFYGVCVESETTCNAVYGAVCRSYRVSAQNNMSFPASGYSDCSRDCMPQYSTWEESGLLVLCCDSYDMCNDVGESVDEYIASIPHTSK